MRIAHYSDPSPGLVNPLDVHQQLRQKNMREEKGTLFLEHANLGYDEKDSSRLELSTWLPFCAPILNISPKVQDYVLVPVVTILSDLPNRNGVGFPLSELVCWNSEHGKQAYKTFTGKPVFVEHANTVLNQARGVIVDTVMRKMTGYGKGCVWKVIELLAIDRTKDPDIAHGILKGDLNGYSMGAWVTGYSCSYCNADLGKCGHINPRARLAFSIIDGHLCYKHAHGIVGFETSIVVDPAYRSAVSNKLMVYSNG